QSLPRGTRPRSPWTPRAAEGISTTTPRGTSFAPSVASSPGSISRARGGYVLGPGSVLDGIGDYVILDDVQMLPAPEGLLDNNWLSAVTTTTLLMAAHSGGGHAIGVTEEWQAVWRRLSTDYLHHGRS